MRVLIVSWLPLSPCDSGYKRRVHRVVGGLSAHCEVFVVSPGPRPEGLPWEEIVVTQRTGFWPKAKLFRTFSKNFCESVLRSASRFRPDVVIAEGLWAVSAASKAAKEAGVALVVTVQNIEGVSARGVYPFPVPQALLAYESSMYRKADLLLSITEDERAFLQKRVGANPPIVVVPNGTDVTDPPSRERVAERRKEWGLGPEEKAVLFVARLDYPPNRKAVEWLASEVCPRATESGQHVQWLVAGKPIPDQPPAPLKFLGFEEDLPLALAAADVCVSPVLQGSGTSIKILDYLGAGRPVVTTPRGVRGIPLEHEKHLLVAEGAKGFARSIVRLLADSGLATHLGAEGRRAIAENLTWDSSAKRLFDAISLLAKNR